MPYRDSLRDVERAVREWCAQREIPVVAGIIDGQPKLYLDARRDEDWGDFREALTALGARIVTVEAVELEDDDVDQVRERGDDGDREYAELLTAHVGHVRQLLLGAITTNAIDVSLALQPEWAGALPSSEEIKAPDAERAAKTPPEEDAANKALARRIAEDPGYQQARPNSRNLVAKRIAGSAWPSDERRQWDVLRKANEIWELDMRPAHDAKLRERALAMKEEGKTKAKIAVALGISEWRLRELIG